MDELFDRIRAAQPNPLLLTDDELSMLEAWLKTHRRLVNYSEMQQAARGDTRLSSKLKAENDWWKCLRFTVEYNRTRPKALPAKTVSQDDRPDNCGYVESPADPAAYAPATDILTKHTPADLPILMDRLVAIIEDHDANRVRWTRPLTKNGRPMKNRRSVHLGDWMAYLKRRSPADKDGFPRLTEAEIEDIERRKADANRLKRAGK